MSNTKTLESMAEVAAKLAEDNPFWVDLSNAFKSGKNFIITLHLDGGQTLDAMKVRELESGLLGVIRGTIHNRNAQVSVQMLNVTAYEIEVR